MEDVTVSKESNERALIFNFAFFIQEWEYFCGLVVDNMLRRQVSHNLMSFVLFFGVSHVSTSSPSTFQYMSK